MKTNVFGVCSGVAVLYFLFLTHVFSREIDLSANLHKNLKVKLGPRPVEKPVSPYFVRILKRRPNYIIEDADEKEIESIPRVLIDRRKNKQIPLQPIFVDNSNSTESSEMLSMEKDATMEESSSNLSATNSAFLPVIGGIFVAAEAEENATATLIATANALNTSEPPSTLLQLLVDPTDASRLTNTVLPLPTTTISPSPNPTTQEVPDETTQQPTTIFTSTNAPSSSTSATTTTTTTTTVSTSTTTQPTTTTTTTTTTPTTTTTVKPTTTTTTTTTPKPTTTTTTTTTPKPTTTTSTTTTTVHPTRSNIKLVQTNQIEVLTFPTTSKPLFTQPRQQNTWTLFQPQPNNNLNNNLNKNNNGNLNSGENNPINAILAAPGNFIMGMFKGLQQATEFFGDTITGFANILLPKKN